MTEPSADVNPYRRAMLATLGDRDPLSAMTEALTELQGAFRELPSVKLARTPGTGEWSALEVLQHLTDAQLFFGVRLRMALTQPDAQLPPYNQEALVSRFRDVESSAELLERLRTILLSTIRICKTLTPEEQDRVDVHPERGPESVHAMVRVQAGHILNHLEQIQRALGEDVEARNR